MLNFLMLANDNLPQRGFRKATICGKEAGLVGVYVNGKPFAPDLEQAREFVPMNYRKAFDRAQLFARDYSSNYPFHMRLNNARGRYIGTLYFQPLTKEFQEMAQASCAESFWEFLRGNIQFPECAEQMRAHGATVTETEIRAARMENRACNVEILGKHFALPQPF